MVATRFFRIQTACISCRYLRETINFPPAFSLSFSRRRSKKLEIIDKMKDCNATKFTSFCFPTFCIHYWWDVRHLALVHRILQPSSNLSNLKARGCQNWQGRIIKGQIRSWQVRKGKVVFQQKGSLTKRPTRRCHAAKKAATKDVAKSAKRMGLDLR